ncbi:MAG: hypothetical protein ABR95_03815 [Sphingobacteriales bacterium BACL12 MAG-120813-bin55]|nr:MAG: hypothetical protein ABR94_01965 [Sphingobacteriales bacterium BACL12 MAG-120802-bin5]KRP13419.1 MAG: hypothetical protein ABR95_03815 [Sphingobacteriales bacterium BACL12 MAG-120813-bin55]
MNTKAQVQSTFTKRTKGFVFVDFVFGWLNTKAQVRSTFTKRTKGFVFVDFVKYLVTLCLAA